MNELFELSLPNLNQAFERYNEVAAPLSVGAPSQLLGELRRRISNVQTLLSNVARLSAENHAEHFNAILMAAQGHPNAEEQFQSACRKMDDIWLFTETFYWAAHRTVKVIVDPGRDKSVRLPGHFGKVSCAGITLVRNHLIEHPYVRNEQFAFGTSNGPTIGGLGTDGKNEIVDAGLFINAIEWSDVLAEAFQKAHQSITSNTFKP